MARIAAPSGHQHGPRLTFPVMPSTTSSLPLAASDLGFCRRKEPLATKLRSSLFNHMRPHFCGAFCGDDARCHGSVRSALLASMRAIRCHVSMSHSSALRCSSPLVAARATDLFRIRIDSVDGGASSRCRASRRRVALHRGGDTRALRLALQRCSRALLDHEVSGSVEEPSA